MKELEKKLSFLKSKLAKYKAGFFVWIGLAVFFIIKIKELSFHFGDGNAYVYMANVFLRGIMPYRDYFLADPPFLVILLTFFKKIFGDNYLLFQLVPIFFELGSAFIIFLILKKIKIQLAFLGSIFYLLSFSIIATSSYLTGVQVVVFFILLAIFSWLNGKSFLSGFFWSLAVLTKLYALASFFGFLIFFLVKKEKLMSIVKFLSGMLLGVLIILGPFLLLSFKNVWQYLVVHQFNRPEGISKSNIFTFYFKREWLFILGFSLGGIISRKKIIILPTLGLILFFLIFQDLYYLYLNSFFPFLIILTVIFINYIFLKNKIFGKLVIISYVIFLLFSLSFYNRDFKEKGEFLNAQEIANFVQKLPKNYDLYGSHEVAPLIALMTKKNLVENYIDTNGQAFASGGQDLGVVSRNVCQQGAYFLAKVIDIPEQNIKDFGFDAYFGQEIFKSCCGEIKKFPDTSGNKFSSVAIYECKK